MYTTKIELLIKKNMEIKLEIPRFVMSESSVSLRVDSDLTSMQRSPSLRIVQIHLISDDIWFSSQQFTNFSIKIPIILFI